MGKDSKIEWTEHTFNPWWGCTKVSEGCQNCYAEAFSRRTGFDLWGEGKGVRYFGTKHWAEPVKWDAAARALGVMHRVFCGSMCDILEDRSELADPRMTAFDLAEATPNLLWLFLTKRAENAAKLYPERWRKAWPRNVMPGFTIENQKRMDERMPHVAAFSAMFPDARIFASCEPLLSALDWTEPQYRDGNRGCQPGCGLNPNGWLQHFSWVIGGGESGPHARPCHPEWARRLRNDCRDRDDMGRPWPLSFLWKQHGEFTWDATRNGREEFVCTEGHHGPVTTDSIRDNCERHGHRFYVDRIVVRRVGKKVAGRKLDGCTWDGVPHLPWGPQLPGVENYGAREVSHDPAPDCIR